MLRPFLPIAIAVIFGVSALAAEPTSKPNIVFLLADDLGYGDVGCYNPQSKIPTPNLDRLAAEGMRFTDAHAPDAVCTPTRYGILTGRYCFRSRLKAGVLAPWGAPLIEDGRLTAPSMLRAQGYATACIGKWHLGFDWPTTDGQPASSKSGLANVDFTKPLGRGPITRGFDFFYGCDAPNFPPYCFIENDHTIGIPNEAAPMSKTGFNRAGPRVPNWELIDILPALTRRAVRYIEETSKTGKPFFLYFPITSPHFPIVPTAEFKGKSAAGDFGDWVVQTDAVVGQVLDALQRAGVAEKTLVVFTSDNGPEVVEIDPGAYERIRAYGHRSMGDWRGVKRDAWEGGHRVAFLARWPGQIKPGAVSDETICHVDFMRTTAAITGAVVPPDAAEDSYNILPILTGKEHPKPLREATILHSANGKFALRQDEWVFIAAKTGDDNGKSGEPAWYKAERGYAPDDQPGELFDLRADPIERRNLYGEKPEIVSRLTALLDKYKSAGRSTPGRASSPTAALPPIHSIPTE
jgi:arylsulfatase A-like enzyme